MKIFAKFVIAVLCFFTFVGIVYGTGVPDDVVGNKYEKAIEFLYQEGIVSGYPDGTFRPDYELNRAELMKFVLEGLNLDLDATEYKNCFPDVKDEWFAKYVCYAKSQNWISGYEDGFFRPGNKINKVETIKIVVNVYGLEDDIYLELPYTDIDSSQWYIKYLRTAYANNLLEEKSGKYFPSNNISRGQISEIVYRYLNDDEEEIYNENLDNEIIFQDKRQLNEDDFEYLGAFRLPEESSGDSTFGWGGSVMAFNPDGDGDGSNDGFPGSLFIVGHDYQQMVAEVDIPIPKDQRDLDLSELNEASYLQSFTDVTEGMAESLDGGNGFRFSGLGYLDGRLYWTARKYYNVDGSDDLSHGMSNSDFSNLNAQGLWRLDGYHSSMTAGYIFTVPEYFADVYLAGKRLISGLFTQQGVSYTSQGPAMFAYEVLENGNAPENGASLDAQALVYYPYSIEGGTELNPSSNFPDYQIPDAWNAAAWVNTDDAHAVLVVGARSMGETYYGDARPDDCTIYKGYHGEPYEPRFLFYDPADLAKVAQGEMQPDEVIPYLEFNPEEYLHESCEWNLTGAVYDEENQLFYVMQRDAYTPDYDPMPLIYVFKVGD